jgi:hypothetical protein
VEEGVKNEHTALLAELRTPDQAWSFERLVRLFRAQELVMKRRIAVWAGLGFVTACCWLLYVLLTPRDQVNLTLRQPAVQVLASISCPITLAARYLDFPLPFWMVALINAAIYALIGLLVEILRGVSSRTAAIKRPVA